MRRSAPVRVAAGLLAGGLAACGAGEAVDAPARQRLWELEGELESQVAPVGSFEPSFRCDFASTEGWLAVVDPDDPTRRDPASLQAEVVQEAGPEGSFLRLRGRRGGLFRIVEVEPGGCYEFVARVRASELVPAVDEWFHGGTYYLGELFRAPAPGRVLAEVKGLVTKHRTLEAAQGSTGWVERRLLFQAGPTTKALFLGCVLGMSEEVVSGEVHFDDVELRHVARESYWAEELGRHGLGDGGADALSWGGRRIRQSLGAESRPSIALLPGETLRFRLRIPRGEPELTLGAGVWWTDTGGGGEADPTLEIALDGERLWSAAPTRPTFLHETRWDDHVIPLERWAGEEVELALHAEGAPGVFGAPLVRDRAARPVGPNVLLFSIDTLRADHVGAYGHEGGTTPHLDELARTGLFVRDFTAQSPYTLPSHVTMFSGQFPSVHGVLGPGNAISSERTPMLAEILSRRGYATRAFTAGGFVNPGFGFDRGFEAYSNLDPLRYDGSPHAKGLMERRPERYSEELFRRYGPHAIARWIEEHADESFFLFVHSYTVHDFDPPPEYLPPSEDGPRVDPQPYMHHEYVAEHGITPEVREDILEYYDAALRYVDDEVGRLLELLERLDIAGRTVVAVTSDHGKELGDRGLIIHGTTLYEELTRVPFLVKVPGMAPRTVDEPGMLIDVAPTLLGALGIEADPRMMGRNLLSPGTGTSRFVWSEIDQLAHKYALRDPSGWKIIHGPGEADLHFPNEREWELYDLRGDPGERVDRSGVEEERARELREKLLRNLEALRREGERLGSRASGDVDDETTEMLRQLGYLGGPDED